MANNDRPNGFTVVRHLTGGIIRMNEWPIIKEEAAAIFTGDMVELLASGYIQVADDGSPQMLGVFAGCRWTNQQGEIEYGKAWPAAQKTLGDGDAVAFVYDDPQLVFAAQASGTPAATLVGALIDLDNSDTGSTTTGRSAQQVDEDASDDDFFRVVRLHKVPNNAWGEFAEIEIIISKHAMGALAGVAI